MKLFYVSLCLIVCASIHAAPDAGKPSADWPSFRGAFARGIADGYPCPTTWNVEKSEGVLWKTPIPGLSHSSPIVWGERIYVATAVGGQANPQLKIGLYGDGTSAEDDTSHRWIVYCLDKRTGKIIWERTTHAGVPKQKRHPKATHANTTLATDGSHVVAFFGSEGLYCYDLAGKQLWSKDLGILEAGPYDAPSLQWGFASSPLIHDGKVLIECDTLKDPFLAAFDVRNGHELWHVKRDDVATWSTPTVCIDGSTTQLIVNGWKHIGGYDVRNGQEIWRLKGGGDIPVPAPIVANGLIYITNAHGRLSPIYAIKASAVGDISLAGDATSNQHVAWSYPRDGSYMATPLVYGDILYICRMNGILNAYNAKTGERLYSERLGTGRTGFSSSPVAADGKVYVGSEEGDIYVVKAGPKYELLAKNPLGEICMATPAISAGVLYYRTPGHVFAIGNKRK